MIKSLREIDETAVKKFNEEATNWTATCPVCGEKLTGTLSELRKHKHADCPSKS